MLSNLLIKNYALIKELEMSPDQGLNIITGETGAGKSIMLGAIGLLLGNRADVKSLYDPSEKCIIEGTFDLTGYDLAPNFDEENLDFSDECIVRREISVAGKSRAFINDTPVNLDTLKRIGIQLLDIHSQNDSGMLGNNEFQLQVVDAYAGNGPTLQSYQKDYQTYREATKFYEHLNQEAASLRKAFDYDQFLLQELVTANLSVDEQQSLETELSILENAAEIKEKLQLVHTYFENSDSSILDLLKSAVATLSQTARLVPAYDSLRERAQSTLIELRDLAGEIEDTGVAIDVDEGRKEEVQERLDQLYLLLKKHQAADIRELLSIQNELSQKVSNVLNLDESLSNAKKAAVAAEEALLKSGNELSIKRQRVKQKIESQILERLIELGIPNATFSIQITPAVPSKSGIDTISFLFSANKGIQAQELKHVASGGEFSRLMMVIKYILADKRKLPTIIFDEIDTGVSGEIAKKMGKMMRKMSENHQIIAITHLHQIASSGNEHYFVYKDHSSEKTVSKIRKLTVEERVMEIAQMIGGNNPSESVLMNAREMILK
jgi:DNA repair protein RecN (Recombination protein N)